MLALCLSLLWLKSLNTVADSSSRIHRPGAAQQALLFPALLTTVVVFACFGAGPRSGAAIIGARLCGGSSGCFGWYDFCNGASTSGAGRYPKNSTLAASLNFRCLQVMMHGTRSNGKLHPATHRSYRDCSERFVAKEAGSQIRWSCHSNGWTTHAMVRTATRKTSKEKPAASPPAAVHATPGAPAVQQS